MSETYVLFELAGTTYGLRTRDVQHMEMVEQITPVPNTSPAVEGVVFSRGQVVPAVNLRVRFGFPREPHTMRTRLIIVQTHQRLVGLIVDAAREFSAIPDEAIRPIQEAVAGMEGNYLKGIASLDKRLVLLLDLETTLNLDQVIKVPSTSDLTARLGDPAEDPQQRSARG